MLKFYFSFPEISTPAKTPRLTLEAITKHDQLRSESKTESKVNDLTGNFQTFSMGDDDDDFDDNFTMKTTQTFASNFSACTNMSYSK